MKKKIVILIFKISSIISVVLGSIMNFVQIKLSGNTLNPSGSFDYSLVFGLLRFPGYINWEGVSIKYNYLPILTFQLVYIISFLIYLIFWIFNSNITKEWIKQHINIIVASLMLISIVGFLISVQYTIELTEIPPTEIISSFRTFELQLGSLFALLIIPIMIIEYFSLRKLSPNFEEKSH